MSLLLFNFQKSQRDKDFTHFLLCLTPLLLLAQKEADAPGSKDHLLVTRMKNLWIYNYEYSYDAVDFKTGLNYDNKIIVEGQKTNIYYKHKYEVQPQPNPFGILKNYQNAVKSIGDTTHSFVSSNPIQYELVIIEPNTINQQIIAGDMLRDLSTEGFYTIYFDTDKADVLTQSLWLVDQVAYF